MEYIKIIRNVKAVKEALDALKFPYVILDAYKIAKKAPFVDSEYIKTPKEDGDFLYNGWEINVSLKKPSNADEFVDYFMKKSAKLGKKTLKCKNNDGFFSLYDKTILFDDFSINIQNP